MKHKNYRRCISCRRVAPKELFWRVVRIASNHKIEIDRGMGRSAYICRNSQCLEQARAKNRLRASLRIKVPEQIYQNLQERLNQ